MAEQTEQRIININDKQYLFDSLDEESQGAFTQAIEINQKIEGKKIEIRDLTYARQYLVGFLEGKVSDFTEVTPNPVEDDNGKETISETPEAEATA